MKEWYLVANALKFQLEGRWIEFGLYCVVVLQTKTLLHIVSLHPGTVKLLLTATSPQWPPLVNSHVFLSRILIHSLGVGLNNADFGGCSF